MTESNLIGKKLDDYHILSQLGEGGMSTIYLGLDTRLQRYTAIKVIHAHLQNDPDNVDRFKREAQAVARLEHPNIVRLYRYGQANDILYMAMQYIEGIDLRLILQNYRQEGKLIPLTDAAQIVDEICQALDYSHKNGVLHRDVKPSNIMLNRDGKAILTDFGLALLSEVDTQWKAFGTPQYMAPEQAQSPEDVGPKSDLYAVGMIIFEMMTGQIPFEEVENPMEMVARRASEPPPRPSLIQPKISPELEAVILKALSLDPADRYQNGAQLSAAFHNSLQLDSLPPPPVKPEVAAPKSPDIEEDPLEKESEETADNTAVAPILTPVNVSPIYTSSNEAPQPRESSPTSRLFGFPLPILGLGGCLVLLILGVLLFGGVQLVRGLLSDRYQVWMPVTVTEVEGDPIGNDAYPDAEGNPNPNTSGESGSENETANNRLQIAIHKEDSFYLINIGETAVSLTPFTFDDGDNQFNGTDWAVESLAPGQCVSIWKDRGNPKPPDVTCNEVGTRLAREPKNLFWKDGFTINYNGIPISTCPDNGCDFSIPN